jgi:hypothetical protein
MDAMVAVGAMAISSEFRSPVLPTRLRSAFHRAACVPLTPYKSCCSWPPAALVCGNSGCAPNCSASSAEASSAVR